MSQLKALVLYPTGDKAQVQSGDGVNAGTSVTVSGWVEVTAASAPANPVSGTFRLFLDPNNANRLTRLDANGVLTVIDLDSITAVYASLQRSLGLLLLDYVRNGFAIPPGLADEFKQASTLII